MNQNLKISFFFWGGDRGGEEWDSNRKKKKTQKTIGIRLFFVLLLYIKFHVPGSSGSLVLSSLESEFRQRIKI